MPAARMKTAIPLSCSRWLAMMVAIGLGISEAVINWGDWQYAPLWIVDYVIVGWLVWSFAKTRSGRNVHLLLSGWAFAGGIFYLALFGSLDPADAAAADANHVLLCLIGLLLGCCVVGFACALWAMDSRK